MTERCDGEVEFEMTIYDIAKMAGVSASSVSRVINGKPGVKRETREKIEMLLKKYHYAPDENARSLVTQTSRTIGILTDDITATRQNEGTTRIEYELLRNGYFCFVKYIGDGEDAIEQGASDLAKRRVEGALFLGVSFRKKEEVTRAVRRYLRSVPVVLVHQTERSELDNVYCVGADEKKGFIRCVEYMAAKGRKNLALLLDENRQSASIIKDGFETGVRQIPHVRGWIYSGTPASTDGGARAASRVLNEHPDIDGLICAQDLIAIGAMNELQDRGIRVPDDISVMGEDNSAFCEVCRPKLTSMDTMLSMSTLMSARMLLDLLAGREQSHKITLEMEIVERATT